MLFTLGGLAFFSLATSAPAASPPIIPLPVTNSIRPGVFTLCPGQPLSGASPRAVTRIVVDNSSLETGQYLATLLGRSTGFQFDVDTNNAAGPIRGVILLTTNNALSTLGAEGYELTVAPDSVVVRAPAQGGMFYGVQSLLQLFPTQIYSLQPVTNVAWVVPCYYIQDYPRFSWRGYMLDPVRHFWNKDEVKQIIDSLAMHKLNVMHIHLDDDSGWRLEIKQYPLLTAQSAWRSQIKWELNPRSSTAWQDNGQFGGYYTQDEMRELVAYAAQRHVTLVPEIEMPGHSCAAVSAYPQYACNCSGCYQVPHELSVTSYPGGVFCIAKPETTNFLQNILTEVMGIFTNSQYIHIGGDEVNFNNWLNDPLDLAMMNTLGISTANPQAYQSWFAQNIANWLKSQGRTMMGWSEIYNGGLVTNSSVDDWLGTRGAQAATNGMVAIASYSGTFYVNKWETGYGVGNSSSMVWSNEPPGQSGMCFITNIYNYEPVPSNVTGANTNNIVGVEGPCWTEWIPSLLNQQFRMFPRMCAVAEITWTPKALTNFLDFFTNRWVTDKQRLTAMGVNFNPYATPPTIGSWASAPATYSTVTWDITSSVTNAGEFDVSFCWKSGANGLDIAWVALLENGVEIDRDTHPGYTYLGSLTPSRPAYVLRLSTRHPGATYTLAASLQGRGGTACTGVIYHTNWD